MNYLRTLITLVLITNSVVFALSDEKSDMLHMVNTDFSERDTNGLIVGWDIKKDAEIRETAYLSGVYYLRSGSEQPFAEQKMNIRNVGGKKYEFSTYAKCEGQGRLGIEICYKTATGNPGSTWAFRDLALIEKKENYTTQGYKKYTAEVTIPAEAATVTAVKLHRTSNSGEIYCLNVKVNDPSKKVPKIVKDAREVYLKYRQAVGEPLITSGYKWASPFAGKVPSVLFIVNFRNMRDVTDFCQRFQIKYNLCWIDRAGSPVSYDAEEINEKLSTGNNSYDVIIVAANIKNEALQNAVKKTVTMGTGLLYLRKDGDSPGLKGFENILAKTKTLSSDNTPEFFRHVPFQYFPVLPDNHVYSGKTGEASIKNVAVDSLGQGKVVVINYGRPGGVRGLLPSVANNPSKLGKWWEYAYSLLGKSLLYCSDYQPVVKMASLKYISKDDSIIAILEAKNKFEGKIYISWDNKEGIAEGLERSRNISLNSGQKTKIKLPLPAQVKNANGLFLANIVVKDAADKVVDWGTVPIEKTTKIRIVNRNPFKYFCYGSDEVLDCSIILENSGVESKRILVDAELNDVTNRCIWKDRKLVDINQFSQNQTEVSFKLSRQKVVVAYHTLKVTISDDKGVVDRRDWEVCFPDKWSYIFDDFYFGSYGDPFLRAPADKARFEWIRNNDFGFVAEGGVFDQAAKYNMPWADFGIAHKWFHYYEHEQIRELCLNDKNILDKMANEAVSGVRTSKDYGALFYNIGDESELVRDGWAEVCFCPICTEKFRQWTKGFYTSLEKVNLQWGTKFTAWDQITPITGAEARKRGNFAQWVDFRTFMDDVWIGAFQYAKDKVKEKYPEALLAFTNPFELNPFSGNDHYKLAIAEDVFMKYARPDLIDEYRSFNPSALMLTFFGYTMTPRENSWLVWWFALKGGDIATFYDMTQESRYSLYDGQCRPTERSLELAEKTKDLLTGTGKILRDSSLPLKNQIAVLYSQASMHVSWAEGNLEIGKVPWGGGLGVMNALPPSESFGLRHKSGMNIKTAIKTAQLQHDAIAPDQILRGELKNYRLLILPYSIAISDQLISEISNFVKQGGVVLADLRPGVYDEHGKLQLNRPQLESLFGFKRQNDKYLFSESKLRLNNRTFPDELFGPLGREALTLTSGKAKAAFADGNPAIITNRLGKGYAIYLNFVPGVGPESSKIFNEAVRLAAIKRNFQMSNTAEVTRGYECFEYQRNKIKYLAILRDISPSHEKTRGSFFGQRFRQTSDEKENLHLDFAAKYHIYDLRSGQYLGHTDSIDTQTQPEDCKVLALLPYKVKSMNIDGLASSYKPGSEVNYKIMILPEKGDPGDHLLRIEVYNPKGILVKHYTKKVWASAGVYEDMIPLAYNDILGVWKIKVVDIISQDSLNKEFNLKDNGSSD